MSTNDPGPLVRLWGLRTEQLPATAAPPAALEPFLFAILREAIPFVDSAAPKQSGGVPDSKMWKRKGSHAHPDSAAKVEVLERVVPVGELEKVAAEGGGGGKGKGERKGKLRPETWCCRRSVHEDKPAKGSASWEEFVRSFRDEHAASERAFTPACMDAHQALAWDCGDVQTGEEEEDEEEGGRMWGRFGLVVQEMRHRIGRPVLKDRTFPVLQMTASAISDSSEDGDDGRGFGSTDEFIVVSIPVPDFGTAESSKLAKEKGAQIASYVSVERIRRIRDGDGDGSGSGSGSGKIEWLMATASDAGGVLPAWVQNAAAPGVIWKDVPLFLRWIARERVKKQGGSEVGGGGKGETAPNATEGVRADDVTAVSDGVNHTEAAAPGNP
ncbi:hypothetical protein F5Y11DRAFT_209692 [Daldinia sp. FL1419]|nr:hypothetical protein F5Y11DRAFT_209692 [Daldinia sp. FL1419]